MTQTHATATRRPRTPVLLIPGWNGRAREMRHIERFLGRSGWPSESVSRLEFRDIRGSNVEHAAEIAAAVESLIRGTGASSVDIVAHSMGGLATRWYLAHNPSGAPVRRAVFIGTPHRGTWLAWAAWGEGCREMRPGSEFLCNLDAAGHPDHVRTYTIRTELETRVLPPRNAILDGAVDRSIGLTATHPGLLRSPRVCRLILECLADQDGDG